MKSLIAKVIKFDSFLKHQLAIGLVISLTWSLIIPLIHKLQGLYWTTTYISIYLILMRSSGLFVPYLKGIGIKKAYICLMMLNIVYVIGTYLYFVNKDLFLWIEVALTILFSITSQVFAISWDLFIISNYGKETFEDYKYSVSVRDSIGGIGGYSIAGLVYMILDQDKAMILFIIATIVALVLQFANYRIHYVNMED